MPLNFCTSANETEDDEDAILCPAVRIVMVVNASDVLLLVAEETERDDRIIREKWIAFIIFYGMIVLGGLI